MDLSSIAQVTSGIAGVGSHTASPARNDAVVKPAAKSPARPPQGGNEPAESTRVHLSVPGQVKGAVAELQTAARTLAETKSTATAADTRNAAENFVNAYNKAQAAAANAKRNEGGENAGAELRRAVSERSAEFRSAGIAQDRNGSLSLDAKALDKALRETPAQTAATIAEVGRRVDKAATRGLDDSHAGAANTPSDMPRRALQGEHSARPAREPAPRAEAPQPANAPQLASGITAYQRNFLG